MKTLSALFAVAYKTKKAKTTMKTKDFRVKEDRIAEVWTK